MPGYTYDASREGVAEVTEFVKGTTAKSRQAKTDTAGAVVAGILSAALFAKRKRR